MRAAERLALAVALTVVALGAGADPPNVTQATGVLVGEMAEGQVALEDATRLRIRGITGRLSIRSGRAGPLRFLSTLASDRASKSAVAVRREPGVLEIGPVAAGSAVARVLEVSVPPGVAVEIASAGSQIEVRGVEAGVRVEGDALELEITAVGSAGLAVRNSRARVAGIDGTLSLDGVASSLEVSDIHGTLFATQAGGTLILRGLAGEADLDLSDTALTVQGSQAPFRLKARGGTSDVEGLVQGGELNLTAAPLTLSSCRGKIDVVTDASVRFENLEADLHVDGYGASVTGTGNSRLVEIVTDGAEVGLREIQGPVRIQGANLTLSLEGIGGELIVIASSSTVSIARVTAPVTVQNEYGDIDVRGAREGVQTVSSDGNVRLTDVAGPVDVESRGTRVEVSWTVLDAKDDSYISNEGGDVDVVFPWRARCRVEATSRSGRVSSELADAPADPDGRRASGSLNQGEGPLVRIESQGSIQLTMTQPPKRDRRVPREVRPEVPSGGGSPP
jgi:hypothetical protein